MADPEIPPIPYLWREEKPLQRSALFGPLPSRRRVFVILIGMLSLIGGMIGLLFLLRPVPKPYFLPLWITEYQGRRIPPVPQTNQDRTALLQANYFPQLVHDLGGLSVRPSGEAAVVYLSGHAFCDENGQIFILLADADPDNPRTNLALRKILESLRDCPARHKLLILDVFWPLANPRLGILANDVAGRIEGELEAVEDPHRLVLCACSPGQVPLASEELGRSVFGYYLEEGLRGWADLPTADDPGRGRVSVKQLAIFVQRRVDQWAIHNRNTRQTPVLLGSGSNFPLVVLPHSRPAPHLEIPPPGDYPAWLSDAWKVHDQWQADEGYRLAPRVFRQLETTLLETENAWRSGGDLAHLQQDRLVEIERLQEEYKQARTKDHPEPRSLALAAALGARPDKEVSDAVAEFLKKLDELPGPTAKPGEAEQARDKLVAELGVKFKEKPEFAVAWAIFEQAAADPRPSRERLRLLDRLARLRQPDPAFVETYFLHRLAELPETGEWPTDSIRRSLEVTRLGEKAANQVRAFPWVKGLVQDAAQKRHEGEVVLFARGYAPVDEADQLLAQAAAGYEAALVQGDKVEAAYRSLEEALAFLPAYSPFLDQASQTDRSWQEAVQTAIDLYGLLGVPSAPAQPATQPASTDDLQQKTELLRQRLKEMGRSFDPESINGLLKQQKRPDAGAEVAIRLNALLATPFLTAESRSVLWKAEQELARRLLDETVETDQKQGNLRELAPGPADFEPKRQEWENKEHERAVGRARRSIALLRLGGLDGDKIQKLDNQMRILSAGRGKGADPGQSAAGNAASLGHALREAWNRQLPGQFQEAQNLGQKDRLSRILPPLETAAQLNEEETLAAVRWRLAQEAELWAWLGGNYLYESRDLDGSGFYAAAAFAYQKYALPMPRIQLLGSSRDFELSPTQRSAVFPLQILLTPPQTRPQVAIDILKADEEWLEVTPDLTEATREESTPEAIAVHSVVVPLHVILKPGAERSPLPPPQGFLVRARVNGWTYHFLVTVPLVGTDHLELLIGTDPKPPAGSLGDIRLRPGKVRQPVFLFVRNPGAKPRTVMVELKAGLAAVAGGTATVTVGPGATVPVTFSNSPPAAGPGVPSTPMTSGPPAATEPPVPELPEFHGPLQIRLLDAEKKNATVLTREVEVGVASPREYIKVGGIQYQPPNAKGGKNRLEVKLQSAYRLPSPSVAELVLPPERIPGLIAVNRGTLRGEVLPTGEELKLFAEQIQFDNSANEDGFVYITVDDCERAFVFHTTFARRGEPTTPQEDNQPALRLRADKYILANAKYTVGLEVDNAPTGATVEMSLGRTNGGLFEPSLVRKFPEARHTRVGFALRPDGALLFDAALRDWTVDLDVGSLRGQHTLRARLLDPEGKEILDPVFQTVVLDDQLPQNVQLVGIPRQARRDIPLPVKAVGSDPVSGISKVLFFIGLPENGKLPANVATVPGHPVDPAKTTWTAQLPLPTDRKGPTDISVQVINRVGLSTFARATVDLVDFDPVKTAPGAIRGRVMEGILPQAGLEVVLKDDKGNEKAKKKAGEGGEYLFENLPPGKYRLSATKSAAIERKGEADATVEPGQTVVVNVELFL